MKFAIKKIAMRTLLTGVLAGVMLTPCLAATNLSFHDVSAETDAWCYTQIVKATEVGLMNGYGNGVFGKNDSVTRGQMAQILYNYYGEDCGTDSGFSDVSSSAWYAKAVAWASGEEIVSGYPDGAFRPNAPLTREQMATVLYNLADRPGVDSSVLSRFRDCTQVADYTADSFAWALSNKIISGTDTDTLSPRGIATRAQTAVILVRYLECVEGIRFPDVTVPTRPEPSELPSVGKRGDYPTSGDASAPNANGFCTKANVEIAGAQLRYETIPYINAFLAKHADLKNTADASWDTAMHWVTTDEQEEYTLLRAKEAYTCFADKRPDGSGILSGENLYRGTGEADTVIKAWANSKTHAAVMLDAGCQDVTVCVASCRGVWVMTVWSDEDLAAVKTYAPNNYFLTE